MLSEIRILVIKVNFSAQNYKTLDSIGLQNAKKQAKIWKTFPTYGKNLGQRCYFLFKRVYFHYFLRSLLTTPKRCGQIRN